MNFMLGFALGEIFTMLILYMGYNWNRFKEVKK